MHFFWWWPFGRVAEIAAPDLAKQLASGKADWQILDVRTRMEWSHSHIAGALNIPITELSAQLASLPLDRERPVVAICRSAHRSIPAVRLLKKHGFTQVCQLQGGMRAWWRDGLPVAGHASGDNAACK